MGGSIGSMIGSLLVAYGFSFWIHIPLIHLLIMAVLGNIAGQMGDLLESAYKRSAGVKDSGTISPGTVASLTASTRLSSVSPSSGII